MRVWEALLRIPPGALVAYKDVAEQAVHSRRNRERHVLQRLHAVGIGLGYVANV